MQAVSPSTPHCHYVDNPQRVYVERSPCWQFPTYADVARGHWTFGPDPPRRSSQSWLWATRVPRWSPEARASRWPGTARRRPEPETQSNTNYGPPLHSRIIKVTHHLADDTASYPPSLHRLMEHLAGVIVPAFLSPETALRIRGNAKEWTWTTLLILRDHYEACRDTDLLESGQGDWEAPFEVANKWASRNLGCRLQDTTVLQARTWLEEQLRAQKPEPVTGPSRVRPPADSARSATVPAPLEDNRVQKNTDVGGGDDGPSSH